MLIYRIFSLIFDYFVLKGIIIIILFLQQRHFRSSHRLFATIFSFVFAMFNNSYS